VANPLDELRALRDPLDRHLHELSGASLTVFIYVWRRTAGWGKVDDVMTVKQICVGVTTRNGKRLDYGTGLSRRTVLRALEDLQGRSLVAVAKRYGKPSRYRLQGVSPVAPGSDALVTGTGDTDDTHTVQSITEQLVRPASAKRGEFLALYPEWVAKLRELRAKESLIDELAVAPWVSRNTDAELAAATVWLDHQKHPNLFKETIPARLARMKNSAPTAPSTAASSAMDTGYAVTAQTVNTSILLTRNCLFETSY
jgi:hypothetical protein